MEQITCENCGQQIAKTTKCPKCNSYICKECGHKLQRKEYRCSKCGKPTVYCTWNIILGCFSTIFGVIIFFPDLPVYYSDFDVFVNIYGMIFGIIVFITGIYMTFKYIRIMLGL